MKTLRMGLIGAGKHGVRYAQHIQDDVATADLVALCRRDHTEGQKLAHQYHCQYYSSYEQLVEDPHIDALVIVVPPYLHGPIVEAACRAQKPLLIEKPFAVSVAEAQRMIQLLAAHSVRCMIGQTLRFNGVVQTLKRHLPEIAPLHALYLSQRFEPSPLGWLDDPAKSGGGIALHTGVHSFDLLRFLSGHEVTQAQCQTNTIFTHDTEDNFLMHGRTDDPLLTVQVAGSRSTQGRSGLVEITGENGQLVGDHVHNFAYLIKGRERTPLAVPPSAATVRETLQAFVTALQHATEFPITAQDGLRAVAIAEACYRSARTNQPVRVEY